MSAKLTIIDNHIATFVDMPLEQSLEYLSRYGRPRVSKLSEGWHCSVEVFVTGPGVQFEVKTGFNHATPRDAAALCCDRLNAALKGLSK